MMEDIEVKRNSSKDNQTNDPIHPSLHRRESASYRWRPRSVLLKDSHSQLGSQDRDFTRLPQRLCWNLTWNRRYQVMKMIEGIKMSHPPISCTFIFPHLTQIGSKKSDFKSSWKRRFLPVFLVHKFASPRPHTLGSRTLIPSHPEAKADENMTVVQVPRGCQWCLAKVCGWIKAIQLAHTGIEFNSRWRCLLVQWDGVQVFSLADPTGLRLQFCTVTAFRVDEYV